MKFVGAVAVVLGTVICPIEAMAQNTTMLTAAMLPVNRDAEFYLDGAVPERWWFTGYLFTNRSYCVEQINSRTNLGYFPDAFLQLYESNGTTSIATNQDAAGEPNLYFGARICTISDTTSIRYIRADQMNGAEYHAYNLRFVETTLFSPWYSTDTGSGYASIAQIRNNSNIAIQVRVTYRTLAGQTLCAPFNFTVPSNGVGLAYASNCGVSSANGGIEIAHNGPPGSISANNTTLSGQSGLSFDAPFTPRQDWARP